MLRRGPMYERGALSRQDDLKKVGINIKITLLDTAGFRDRHEKGDFQAYTVLSAVPIRRSGPLLCAPGLRCAVEPWEVLQPGV